MVREKREELGISQRELARLAHVSQQTINRYENHNVPKPSFAVLVRVADVLGVTPLSLTREAP